MTNESTQLKDKGEGTGARRGAKRKDRETTRVSLEEFRSKLDEIGGMDEENYHYRWAFDDSENGARVYELRKLGYEFADAREHDVPVIDAFETGNSGETIIRRSNGKTGGWMYLMRQPMEYYLENKAYRKRMADEAVAGVRTPTSLAQDKDGVYGSIKIE